MKDRLKYVIDSRYFGGTCLTSMSDEFRNDYGGETIEELRIRENNPYLKAVTSSEMQKTGYHSTEPFLPTAGNGTAGQTETSGNQRTGKP